MNMVDRREVNVKGAWLAPGDTAQIEYDVGPDGKPYRQKYTLLPSPRGDLWWWWTGFQPSILVRYNGTDAKTTLWMSKERVESIFQRRTGT